MANQTQVFKERRLTAPSQRAVRWRSSW